MLIALHRQRVHPPPLPVAIVAATVGRELWLFTVVNVSASSHPRQKSCVYVCVLNNTILPATNVHLDSMSPSLPDALQLPLISDHHAVATYLDHAS